MTTPETRVLGALEAFRTHAETVEHAALILGHRGYHDVAKRLLSTHAALADGPDEPGCPAHGPHPHDGRRCLDCAECAGVRPATAPTVLALPEEPGAGATVEVLGRVVRGTEDEPKPERYRRVSDDGGWVHCTAGYFVSWSKLLEQGPVKVVDP